ncbi:ribonuclease HII [Priestia flexa]|jgi:ribonuclease HII|uniref:Ribonuclease HII n=2 Tax=Priestia TaxID=2800373 RepID=A0A0V8JSL7_9BACI|nr:MULTISPECIES: ribonuclease HII [Bacillaceae]AQX54030.1 ribonuclease HII [Priestia flexa]KSU89680.1 ribonuclease H [Priestia veravalensis]KZB93288.1 ribonuclease HII [Bacillus sp. VT 712]MBN8250103.1 ribonuclease HII [Priestia flexa]MBN8434574.1 ribonuclease HII [Priestia flexa]
MKLNINDIKQALQAIDNLQDPLFAQYEQDERKGVQQAVVQRKKQIQASESLKEQFYQMLAYENKLYDQGLQFIAGVDEVGRGPLAGPVVAAAVILSRDFFLPGLTDSKKLSEAKREEFYEQICQQAVAVGVGIVDAATIDKLNIYQATKKAMLEAIEGLSIEPQALLIDAMELPLNIPQESIIKGDATSISIAASSVVAKVTRDRMMKELALIYPEYGFEKHMGYGTKQHLEAIDTYGILKEHRRSFAPIKEKI